MKRKICIALLAVLTTTAFAGCGGTDNNTAQENTDVQESNVQESSTQADSADEGAAGESGKSDSGEITVYTALEDEQVSD